MDVSVISAGLAWAVPVRPDDLGAHLQAHEKILPTLTALRLCHRYGQAAPITKVPLEILHIVEDLLYQHTIDNASGHWKWTYRHYESRCEPFIDHTEDPTILYECKGDFEDLCNECKEDTMRECTICDEKVMQEMNETAFQDYDYHFDMCEPIRSDWERMIDQRSPTGQFAKYDKILLKYFGLEAFFAPTRKAAHQGSPWLEDSNLKWHDPSELKTSICYLTLPRKQSTEKTYTNSDMESDCGSFTIEGAQSSIVEIPSVATKVKKAKQFNRALRLLKLEPYVHPSQLIDRISPEITVEEQTQRLTSNETDDARDQNTVKMDWPQLIMVVKTVASCV